MLKKLISVTLVSTLSAMLFVGCGSTEQTAEPSKTPDVVSSETAASEETKLVEEGMPKDTKLTIRTIFTAHELDGVNSENEAVYADFYDLWTNAEVVEESGGTALVAKIAAGDAPHLIRFTPANNLARYVDAGVLMPIDDLLAESEYYDPEDLFTKVVDINRYDGTTLGKGALYGLPLDWSTNTIYVKPDVLDAAGVRVPSVEEPWTYAEFHEAIEKMSVMEDGEVSCFGLYDSTGIGTCSSVNSIIRELNANGLSLWSDDYTKVTFTENPEAMDIIKNWCDHYISGRAPSSIYQGDGWSGFRDPESDLFAMEISGLYRMNGHYNKLGDSFTMVPLPVTEDGYAYTELSPTSGYISTSAEEIIEPVWDLYEMIFLGKMAEMRASSGKNLPIKKSYAELAVFDNETKAQIYECAEKMADTYEMYNVVSPYNQNGQISTFCKYLEEVCTGAREFEEAMGKAASEMQVLIDEAIAF